MGVIAEFFMDPLVWPAYIYLLAYSFAWFTAFVLARLFISQRGIERAVIQAWGIAISMHILGGTFLIVWVIFRAKDRVAEWFQVPLYLVLYIIIIIVDIGLLISLSNQREKKEKAAASTQKPPSKSRNPKKVQ